MEEASDPAHPNLAFATVQQHRCEREREVSSTVIGLISVTICVVALVHRAWRDFAKQFKFPDNAFSVALMTLIIFHSTMLVHLSTGNSQLLFDTPSRRAICRAQALLMHWTICALVWNAIYTTIVLYLLVVRRIPLPTICGYNRVFYGVVFGIPTLIVTACVVIGGGYTPAGDDNICWINQSNDRIVYNTSFMMLGMLVFFVVCPPVMLALFRAYRAVDEPSRARVFRTMMIRLLVLAFYALVYFCFNVLVSITNMILRSNHESAFAQKTVYTYCMMRTYQLVSMGALLAITFSVKKRHCKSIKAKLIRVRDAWRKWRGKPSADPRASAATLKDRNVYVRVVSESDLDRVLPSEYRIGEEAVSSPRSPGGRHLFPSAAFADGQTAVSIPPDPQHHRAHLIASQAYTSYVLEHARERLMSDSSFASSSSRSLRHLDSLLSATDFSGPSHTSYVSPSSPQPPQSVDTIGKAVTEL